MIAAARERGMEVVGELEVAWRLLAQRVHRGDRHERQDDDRRAARRDAPRGRRAGGGRRQRRHAALVARRLGRARRGRGVRGVELPARGHGGVRARVRGAAEPRARPPRPSRHVRGVPRGEAARVREPGARGHRASEPPFPPTARFPPRSSACAARTTWRTRWRRRRRRSPRPGAGRGCRGTTHFGGVPHRLEDVAEARGVTWVNDSKATNVSSARVGIEAFDGGVHLIVGGSLKGGGFEGLREPVAARCKAVYLIGEAADRLAARPRGDGVPLQRCGDLERAVAAAAGAAAARRRRAAVAGVRELRPVRGLRGARRRTSASWHSGGRREA